MKQFTYFTLFGGAGIGTSRLKEIRGRCLANFYGSIVKWIDGLDEFTCSLVFWWMILGERYHKDLCIYFWVVLDNRPSSDKSTTTEI